MFNRFPILKLWLVLRWGIISELVDLARIYTNFKLMANIKERAENYANSLLYISKNYDVSDMKLARKKGYAEGASDQLEIDKTHMLMLEQAHEHDKQLFIAKTLDAFCIVECQRKPGMTCAHDCDGGCTKYRQFNELIKKQQ